MKKQHNKLIKSKKYQGIYYKDTLNDKIFYIAYKNSNGNYSKYKVGLQSSGINEKYCYNLRNEEKDLKNQLLKKEQVSWTLAPSNGLYLSKIIY